jgi:WD40 repeat protein
MKLKKITFSMSLNIISSLFCLLISMQTMSLQQAQSLLTPQQRRALIARQAAFRKIQEQKKITIASSTLPSDMTKYEIKPWIINPVIDYLKTEIIKDNVLYPTILQGHPAKITYAGSSKNGKVAATCSEGDKDNLIIWDVENIRKLHSISLSVPNKRLAEVELSPDGSKVVSVFNSTKVSENNPELEITESTLILLDAATGKQIKTLDIPHNYMNEILFSFDSKRIVVVGAPAKIMPDANINEPESKAYIYIADANTGNSIATHETINDWPTVTENPNGNTMVIRSSENLILYDLNTGKMITKLDGPTQKIYPNSIQYSADGRKIIASDTLAETVFIWGGETGKQLKQFNIPALSSPVALNSNATRMVTVSNDYMISIWDVATEKIINSSSDQQNAMYSEQQNAIYSIEISPDNSMIAATTERDIMFLYNANTGEFLTSLNGDEIEFSSDNKRILTHKGPIFLQDPEAKCTMTLLFISQEFIHRNEIYIQQTFVADHQLFDTSLDLLNIISPDKANDHNFILWTPFSDQNRITLAKIQNDLSIAQAQYIHQLYTAKLSDKSISFTDSSEFKQLRLDVQNMIKQYLGKQQSLPTIKIPYPLPKPGAPLAPAMQRSYIQPPTLVEERSPVKAQQKTQTWWQWVTGQ